MIDIKNKIFSCLFFPFSIPSLFITSCNNKNIPNCENIIVEHNTEFGGCNFLIKHNDLDKLGYKYGDSINITISGNKLFYDIPYYNNFYGYCGELIFIDYPLYEYLYFGEKSGEDIWDKYGLSDNSIATISLNKAKKYLDIQNALSFEQSNNREDYNDDEAFANFRKVKSTKINNLYRGVTPCDPSYIRYKYADDLLHSTNIDYLISLNTNDTKLALLMDLAENENSYCKSLYNQSHYYANNLTACYYSQDFLQKTKQIFEFIINEIINRNVTQQKVYIHCTEGKDRTGFICFLIESICGCTYEEIKNDYLTSFVNFYKIDINEINTRTNMLIKYYLNELFFSAVKAISDTAEHLEDWSHEDLKQISENYLLYAGLNQSDIDKIINFFTNQS